ncbi:MAG: hypothetical protein JWO35_576 [Candidatus Saccharibacteria bacterium]|nr:hypothetical protein [Candidatus Saccharibacteria bacterium]
MGDHEQAAQTRAQIIAELSAVDHFATPTLLGLAAQFVDKTETMRQDRVFRNFNASVVQYDCETITATNRAERALSMAKLATKAVIPLVFCTPAFGKRHRAKQEFEQQLHEEHSEVWKPSVTTSVTGLAEVYRLKHEPIEYAYAILNMYATKQQSRPSA